MADELFLEIRAQEMPIGGLQAALRQLTTLLFEALTGRGLGPRSIVTGVTPRRLMITFEDLPDAEPELTRAVDREGAIEVLLSNGRRLRLTGAFDVDIVARLARRLDA